jgi:hypothetical protein
MFRRMVFPVMAAAALPVAMLASPASAAAPNRTTITIACDRATAGAVAVVTLYDHFGGTPVGDRMTVTCGTDPGLEKRERVVVATPSAVGAASIGGYEVTGNSETVTCAGEGTLAFELACTEATGGGAKVTVR